MPVRVFSGWLTSHVGDPTAAGRQANAMMDQLMASSVDTPEQAAVRLAVSVRTLQRMAHRHVGLPPAAILRRRRLQEAVERIRSGEATDLVRVAAPVGDADHAHLATDFRTALDLTPSMYRSATSSKPRGVLGTPHAHARMWTCGPCRSTGLHQSTARGGAALNLVRAASNLVRIDGRNVVCDTGRNLPERIP